MIVDAKMKEADIDDIVLVGGSTRIPHILQLLEGFFDGKAPNKNLSADEAVAHGAAVQAGILAGTAKVDTVLLDITPISLGMETNAGIFETIVPRNTPIPVSKSQDFATVDSESTKTAISVYEGERRIVKDNNLSGQFELSGFPTVQDALKHSTLTRVVFRRVKMRWSTRSRLTLTPVVS